MERRLCASSLEGVAIGGITIRTPNVIAPTTSAQTEIEEHMEPRPAAALVLVRPHRLLRGDIDRKIIILIVLVFVLFGVAAWVFKW